MSGRDYAKEAFEALDQHGDMHGTGTALALLAIHEQFRRLADVAESWAGGAFNYNAEAEQEYRAGRSPLGGISTPAAPPDWELIERALAEGEQALEEAEFSPEGYVRPRMAEAAAEVRRCRGGGEAMKPDHDGLPVIPPLPPGEPNLDPNPPVAKCGECGMVWRQMMFYSCGNARCPMQPRVTV